MERTGVNSSNLSSVGYDEKNKILEIEFLDSSIYQYSNVPPEIHGGLMNANSCGKYFDQNIKNIFPYKKI